MPTFIRVPQGKICRFSSNNTDFNGLYTDDFSSCNIIVLYDSQKISMIHADPNTDPKNIYEEKNWVGDGCKIRVYLKKEDGDIIFKGLSAEFERLFPGKVDKRIEDKSTLSISAIFEGRGCKIESSRSKARNVTRHPMEAQLETIHKIHVGFFYVLQPAFQFNTDIISQWKSSINNLVFDGEYWTYDNAAFHLCEPVKAKIEPYKKDSKEAMVSKMSMPLLECSQRTVLAKLGLSRQEKKKALESDKGIIQRNCDSLSETIWGYHNNYKMHEESTDANTLNADYEKIRTNRLKVKTQCEKISNCQNAKQMKEWFEQMLPSIKKYYCKDESIVDHESIPFIDNINTKLQKLKNKQEAEKETALQIPSILPLERKDDSHLPAFEQADTGSVAVAAPLVFLQTIHANSNSQPSAVAAEEEQPRVLREKPKPVFQTNNGSGFNGVV